MTYLFWLYQAIFYRPILNILVYFYETVAGRDFGIAIILVTLLIRLVLYPLFHKSAKHQMALQRLQPKIKKIQELHKNDKQKQTEATMALYKEHGVNPFLSIILLIVQLPILITLYRIILSGLGTGGIGSGLYAFMPAPNTINALFLGILNLKQGSIILVLLAAIAQYFQSRLAIYRAPNAGPPSPAEKMARQMTFIGPVITIVIFYNLPAGVGLYWLTSSIFSIIQQVIVNKRLRDKYGE
jgi:YidC/Oxa1 family membrane protein insertase